MADSSPRKLRATEIHFKVIKNSILAEKNPALVEMASRETTDAALYLCENFTCQAPLTDPEGWQG